MARNGFDDAILAEKVRDRGVKCDRTMISRYRRGVRRPEWEMIRCLREISGDLVTADDYETLSEAAE